MDHVKLIRATGSCKVDGTTHYAEDYATQRIYVTCGVRVAREVKVQNNARKTVRTK